MFSILRPTAGRMCAALAICAGFATALFLSSGSAAAEVVPACSYAVTGVQPAGCGYNNGHPPTITVQPVDTTGYENGSVQFTAAASTDGMLTAWWEYSFDNGATWNATGQYTDTYTLGSLTLTENEDLVRAGFSDSYGTTYTQAARLTVLPAQPVAALSATTLSFGEQQVRTTSTAQTVTVTNTGTSPLVFGTAYVYSGASYSIVGDTCSGRAVAPGTWCDISVSFQPDAPGPISTYLVIDDNSGNTAGGVQFVELDGFGSEPPMLGPDANLSGVAGMPLSYLLTVAGTPTPSTSVIAGALPPGVNLEETNTIYGTPTSAGTYQATIEADNGTGTPADETLTFTITARPRLTISPASVTEGDQGTTTLTFTYRLSHPAAAAATFHYATKNGTAVAGSDYIRTSGTAAIDAGTQTGQIAVTVKGDTQVEPDEQFTLALGQPSGIVLGTRTATGTIVNDD